MEQHTNPYASPTAPLEPNLPKYGEQVGGLQLASTGQRLANFFIDRIITAIVGNVAGFVLGLAYGASFAATGRNMTDGDTFFLQVIAFFMGITIAMAYFIISEGLGHRTIGKLITGTRVVDANGGPPTFGQIVGRSFSRLIPFEAFSFLGGNGTPVGWHDSLPGTRVVRTR